MGEALATCPKLVLVEPDPARAEKDWEEIVRRLEDNGFAVESAQLGTAYFDTRGVERLYGGLEQALKRALAAVGSHWDARVGAATAGSPPLRQPTSRAQARFSSSPTSTRGTSSPRFHSACSG